MSELIRWDPFREMLSMRSMMDRILEDWERPAAGGPLLGAPPLDLMQTPDDVIVRMMIPGVKPDDIEISVTGDVLSVRGEVRVEQEKETSRYHVRELRQGSFARSIALPAPVVADKAEAKFQDGLLTLRLPKAEEVKPKMISIKAK
jgi:HSP20 family protein